MDGAAAAAAAAAAAGDEAELVRGFDLRALPPAFYEDPYPFFRALRRHSPVHRLPDGSWFLTRHADLFAIYRDTATFSSDKQVEFTPKFGAGTPLLEHHTTSLIFNDPPLHTRVRRLITGALTPRAVAAMEEGVVSLVGGLLDRMEGAPGGRVDLVEAFAAAIPVEVIGNLLDVPREDRGPLRDWSLGILGALEPLPTPEALAWGNRAVTEFCDYLARLVADRRRRPGDPEKDVLTRLIRGEADGERLSEPELLQNCIFILNAGHETTTNLIGGALWLLCLWPGERARLAAEPDGALMKGAVEEFLRHESSVQLGNRRATRACSVGGVELPEGALITLCIAGANRDPEVFADPDRLDLGRRPNPHLGFAGGPHVCAGLAVARLEARVALSMFLRRFPRYALDGEPERDLRARFRGFRRLPAVLR